MFKATHLMVSLYLCNRLLTEKIELVARPVVKVAFVKVTALSVPYVTCAVPALPRIMSANKWPVKYLKKKFRNNPNSVY